VEGDVAHHLARVLRAERGQLYELSDGERLWLGRIEKVGRERIEFALVEELPAVKPRLGITLLLAIVKFDALEWALEKATELGVSKIVPLAAARSEKALVAAAPKRAERWRKILLEASQQSRRLRPPDLEPLGQPYILFRERKEPLRLLLSERGEAAPLRSVLSGAKGGAVALAIGPEGGWTEAEFAAGEMAGFAEVSLGSQILRTETAVAAGIAVLNYVLGGDPALV
jgi:16S rRNA (uracil1498-N3)-methyltransferase